MIFGVISFFNFAVAGVVAKFFIHWALERIHGFVREEAAPLTMFLCQFRIIWIALLCWVDQTRKSRGDHRLTGHHLRLSYSALGGGTSF